MWRQSYHTNSVLSDTETVDTAGFFLTLYARVESVAAAVVLLMTSIAPWLSMAASDQSGFVANHSRPKTCESAEWNVATARDTLSLRRLLRPCLGIGIGTNHLGIHAPTQCIALLYQGCIGSVL